MLYSVILTSFGTREYRLEKKPTQLG